MFATSSSTCYQYHYGSPRHLYFFEKVFFKLILNLSSFSFLFSFTSNIFTWLVDSPYPKHCIWGMHLTFWTDTTLRQLDANIVDSYLDAGTINKISFFQNVLTQCCQSKCESSPFCLPRQWGFNHCFRYWPILIYIGNILSGFEVPDMILALSYRLVSDSRLPIWADIDKQYCRYWYLKPSADTDIGF